MPTINNLRGLLLEFSNGFNLEKTLLIKNDGILPFINFDLGASYAPINNIFATGINIGSHAGIATDGTGLLLTVDSIEYALLKDNKVILKKTMDVSGQKIYGLPEPIDDNEAASKQYVDNAVLPNNPYQQGATSININASHYNKELRASYTSAMNYVLPADAPKGTWFGLTNMTNNPVTVSAGTGVNIYSKDGKTAVNGQYARIYAYADGINWYLSGDLI